MGDTPSPSRELVRAYAKRNRAIQTGTHEEIAQASDEFDDLAVDFIERHELGGAQWRSVLAQIKHEAGKLSGETTPHEAEREEAAEEIAEAAAEVAEEEAQEAQEFAAEVEEAIGDAEDAVKDAPPEARLVILKLLEDLRTAVEAQYAVADAGAEVAEEAAEVAEEAPTVEATEEAAEIAEEAEEITEEAAESDPVEVAATVEISKDVAPAESHWFFRDLRRGRRVNA